jgi:hypothetical protein
MLNMDFVWEGVMVAEDVVAVWVNDHQVVGPTFREDFSCRIGDFLEISQVTHTSDFFSRTGFKLTQCAKGNPGSLEDANQCQGDFLSARVVG